MLNNEYRYIDYFKELTKKAYGENESFEDFVQRIAEQYFPGKGKEWAAHYSFQIHFYGICIAACKDCQGECPHHGHQYYLRLKRGSSVPVPWASMEICPKYKVSVERDGSKRRNFVKNSSKAWMSHFVEEGDPFADAMDFDNMLFDEQPKAAKKAKAEQLSLGWED